MLATFTDQQAQLVANLDVWAMVHIQVQGPQQLRLARDRATLEQSAPGGQLGGIVVTAGDGVKSLLWRGPLWAMGTGSMTVADIEVCQ